MSRKQVLFMWVLPIAEKKSDAAVCFLETNVEGVFSLDAQDGQFFFFEALGSVNSVDLADCHTIPFFC